MAAVSGMPGTKPQSLSKPVPGAEAAMTADDLLSSFDAPEIFAEPAVPQTAEDLLNQVGSAEPLAPPEGVAPAQDEFAPEPGFVQANVDQFRNFTTRLQAGLAANDTEKINFMKRKFGEENVRLKDDKLYFRKNGEKTFRKLDPNTLELINDLIPDFAREIVTEAAMIPGEVTGGFVGAGAAGVGAFPGAVAGRVASVPVANAFADNVAALAGVPRDESRNYRTENMIGMGAEAVLPVVGAKVLKYVPGTGAAQQAYKAAKESGEREIVALSKQSEEVLRATQRLAEEGRAARIDGAAVGLPGADVNLMGHHLNPDSPIAMNFAAQAASDSRFINAQQQLAEDWGASLTNTLQEIGRRGNKGPYRPEVLASKVTNAVEDIQKAEGQEIGKFKAKAMVQLKNQRLPLNDQTTQAAREMLQEFGFTPKKKITESITKNASQGSPRRNSVEELVWTPPKNLNSLVGKMGLTSVGEVRAVVNNLQELSNVMSKGANITDLDRLRNSFGATADSLFRTQAGARMGAMSGDLRKTYRQAIEAGLDTDFDRKAFNSAMDEFAALKQNVGVLKNALNEDASAKAIVKNVFTGKDNLEKVRAIKSISPESYASLKEEFVNQMLLEYGSRTSKTGFKSSQFMDSMNKKYGDEFLKEVMNEGKGPSLQTVKDLVTVTERLEETFRRSDVDKMSDKQKTGLMNATIGVLMKSPVKAVSGIGSLLTGQKGTENALIQIMTRDGIEKYVANYPGKIPDKAKMLQQLSNILAESRVYRAGMKQGERATKAVVKEKTMDQSR